MQGLRDAAMACSQASSRTCCRSGGRRGRASGHIGECSCHPDMSAIPGGHIREGEARDPDPTGTQGQGQVGEEGRGGTLAGPMGQDQVDARVGGAVSEIGHGKQVESPIQAQG